MEKTREQPSRPEGPGGAPVCGVIGAVLTVGVLGFWFGIGAALGTKMGPCGGPESHRGPRGTQGKAPRNPM